MPYKNYFGIDFGTTCSGVSVFQQDDEGNLTQKTAMHCGNEIGEPDSSFVAINKETDKVMCGYDAWKKRNKLALDNVLIPSVKMELRSDKDCVASTNHRRWTAGEVAAELFRHIKFLAKNEQFNIDTAVVAIPVGYPPVARQAIRQAAEDAGIMIQQFISEPTAAYMANKQKLAGYSNVLVFDWGGGTLDVSILHISKGEISELAKGGMPKAGNDINRMLAEHIHARLVEKKGISLAFDDMAPELRDEMDYLAEKLKKDFSENSNVRCMIQKYGEFGKAVLAFDYDQWFVPILRPVINEAVKCIYQTLEDAGLNKESIDKVLMVGGSSNLRPIISEIESMFGIDKVVKPENMAWSISDGAAYLALNKGKYISNQNVGIILSDGTPYYFVSKGDPIKNFRKKQKFGVTDTTKQMRLVFTGVEDIDRRYETVNLKGTFGFLDEGIDVIAEIDPNMVLTVRAGSDLVEDSMSPVWKYDRLKCSYKF